MLLPPSVSDSSKRGLMNLYFAYGSNMNLRQMERRCPGAFLKCRARLPEWRYFINGEGYAGIERFSGSEVRGGVWSLQESHWNALDAYEGVDEGCYEKRRIEVRVDSGESCRSLEAWVYLSTNLQYGRPSPEYQSIVLQGGRDLELGKEYLQLLARWSEGPPCEFQ